MTEEIEETTTATPTDEPEVEVTAEPETTEEETPEVPAPTN